MEACEENAYRLFYQALGKIKQQLKPGAKELICEQPTEEGLNHERLSRIVNEQFGDCNIVMLVFILTLLAMSNHETLNAYQQAFNEGSKSGPSYPSKREEELEEQLVDSQKKFIKLQKENEQFRLANERWAQDYDKLLRNTSGTGSEREKELEESVKTEKNNNELLRGKYNLLEQTMKEEREELVGLRRDLHLAQQQRSNEDMTSTVGEMQQVLENMSKELEEVKKTRERYRLERNKYFHELDKQRRHYEGEKKQLQEALRTSENQCDRMRKAFSQISDIVYPPKTTAKTKPNRPAQQPPGHIARGPKHSNDVERDIPVSRRDEQVTGITRLNGHDLLNGHENGYGNHTIPCTGCSKDIPLTKFLEHVETCTVSTK